MTKQDLNSTELPLSGCDAADLMETWLRALVPADGTSRTFGNVECWIDTEGPWAGRVSYSLPTSQWDRKAFNADLVTAIESERSLF